MTYSDEDLDRLFRAARPPARRGDERVGADAIAIREGIIRGTYGRPVRRPRRGLIWAGVTTATAAAVVAVLVAVNVFMPAQQAVALTPPPLEYTPAGTVSEVFADADAALAESPDVARERTVRSVTWGWSIEMDSKEVEIVPQEVTFTWAPGEGSKSTIVAGKAYWFDDELPEGVDPSPYEPGDLIDEVVMPPENSTLADPAAYLEGSSDAEIEAALEVFGATPDSSSGELAAAIIGLTQYWTLDDAQNATLLRMLSDAGGLTVRGETTDRLGRDVIGVQVSQVIPERVETLFISIETGRLVGMESELIKPLQSLPLGVITYSMWDAGEDFEG